MFQFNFRVEAEDENESSAPIPEPVESSLHWLPAQKHEPTPHNLLFLPTADTTEVAIGQTKIRHLSMGSAVQRLQKEGAADNLGPVFSNHTDLIPAVYEGGLKIWECTWDLLHHLTALDISLSNKKVLELGCGGALPAVYCALQGAHITVQDYNEEVISYITIPNIAVNLCDNLLRSTSGDSVGDALSRISSRATFYSGDWGALNQLLLHQQTCEEIKREESIVRTESNGEESKFDIILSSETIYNPACQEKLLDLMTKHLKQDGFILLAAKTHYFGVGGGTQQFVELVKRRSQLQVHTVTTNSSGVKREILVMKFLNNKQ